MKDLLDKISSYYLFNCFVPGTILLVFIGSITKKPLLSSDTLLLDAFVCYFVGLVINRVGSLVIGPIVRYISGSAFEKYDDFVYASSKDAKIELFNEVCNMYRSITAMMALVVIITTHRMVAGLGSEDCHLILLLAILLLFIFAASYIKQIALIRKRVQAVCKSVHRERSNNGV